MMNSEDGCLVNIRESSDLNLSQSASFVVLFASMYTVEMMIDGCLTLIGGVRTK